MPGRVEWVLLHYRMPREPSTPRIAVWRRLRQLGVAQLGDGLVALPADASTREQLEWVGVQAREAGGSAMVWVARAVSAGEERAVVDQMTAAVAAEYRAVVDAARAASDAADGPRRRVVGRLRREVARIARRDYFSVPEREVARRTVAALGGVRERV
ncbi:MAG: Chromate resistance protein ChrB [Acidimicrobiia bacterium]